MLTAWVDESIHVQDATYVLGAVVLAPEAVPPARDRLRGHRPGKAPKFHWRRETTQVRSRFLDEVRALSGEAILVIGTGLNPMKQERARRQCMQVLLHELQQHQVSSATFEHRNALLDRRDMEFIEALRGKRWLDRSITVEFADPVHEPMLWAADAICGASGGDVWLKPDGSRLKEITIETALQM